MRIFILLLSLACLPKSAQGSVVLAVPEAELVAAADIIVFATVAGLAPVQRDGMTNTKVELQVYRAIRGAEPGDVLTMHIPGGDRGGGITVYVPGAPKLAFGDMVFAFLERRGGVNRPLGMAYGLLEVREVAPGDLRVSRNLAGLTLHTRAGALASPSAFAVKDEKLEDFIDRIAATARREGARP